MQFYCKCVFFKIANDITVYGEIRCRFGLNLLVVHMRDPLITPKQYPLNGIRKLDPCLLFVFALLGHRRIIESHC